MQNSPRHEGCERIRRLRTEGRIPDALAAINASIEQHGSAQVRAGAASPAEAEPVDSALVGESIKLSLVIGEHEQAYELYQTLRARPDGAGLLEAEVLARLSIDLPQRPVPELSGWDRSELSDWVAEYLDSGQEPERPVTIRAVDVEVLSGKFAYTFHGVCGWCGATQGSEPWSGSPHSTSVQMGLLVDRDWICQVCFGRLRLNYEGIRDFLVERYPRLAGDEAYDWYQVVVPLQWKLGAPPLADEPESRPADRPRVARRLGQQQAFFISELLTRRLLDRE